MPEAPDVMVMPPPPVDDDLEMDPERRPSLPPVMVMPPPPAEFEAAASPAPAAERPRSDAAPGAYPDFIHPDEAARPRRPSRAAPSGPRTYDVPAPGALVRLGDHVVEPAHGWQGLSTRNAVGVVVSSAFDEGSGRTRVVVAFNEPTRWVADVSELVAADEDAAEEDLVGRILDAHNTYEGMAYAKYAPTRRFVVPDAPEPRRAAGYQFSDVITTPELVHLDPPELPPPGAAAPRRDLDADPYMEPETYATPDPEPPRRAWLCAGREDADGDADADDGDGEPPLEVTKTYVDDPEDGYDGDMLNILLCNSSTVEAAH